MISRRRAELRARADELAANLGQLVGLRKAIGTNATA